MDGKTITKILSSHRATKKIFKGFLTPDLHLSKNRFKTPALFFLNTDTYEGPGEHWCVLSILNKTRAEFFDSFGRSPTWYHFTTEILRHVKRVKFNEYPVQCFTSATCGHHCIFWAYQRAHGLTASRIMKFYNRGSCKRNDRLVYSFVHRKFGPKAARIIL